MRDYLQQSVPCIRPYLSGSSSTNLLGRCINSYDKKSGNSKHLMPRFSIDPAFVDGKSAHQA